MTVVDKSHGEVPDNGIFALNPAFRLRNERDHVRLYGWQGKGDYRLRHSEGIVLALNDGKRTVREIARMVVPLVKDPDSPTALDESLKATREIVGRLLKTEEEQKGQPAVKDDMLPSTAPLVPVSALTDFGRLRAPEYDAYKMIPTCAPEPSACRMRERVPNAVNWHLTAACVTNCLYCYLPRRKVDPRDELTFARALEIIDECRRIGVFHINPGGGDVLLYPYLADFLEAVRDGEFLPVELATKAYCTRDLARRLASNPVVHTLQFSIDSTVEEVADYLTQTPGFCRRTLESIDNAVEAGLSVTTKSVVTPYNILTIPKLHRDLRRRGVSRVILAAYGRSGYYHTDDLFNHGKSYQWLERQLEVLGREFPGDLMNIQNGGPVMALAPVEQRREAWPKRLRCSAGRSHFMICADGKALPCEQMPETGEYFCGDLKVQSVEEVWNGKLLDEKVVHPPREKFAGTPCYDCEDFIACIHGFGNCIRDLSQFYGTAYTVPENCPKHNLPYVRRQ